MKRETIECGYCKAKFTPRHGSQSYCSSYCVERAKKSRIPIRGGLYITPRPYPFRAGRRPMAPSLAEQEGEDDFSLVLRQVCMRDKRNRNPRG